MFNVCADVYWVTVPSYGYLAIASPSPWHCVISHSRTTPHPLVNLMSLQLCLHLLQTSCGSCSQKLQIYLLRSKNDQGQCDNYGGGGFHIQNADGNGRVLLNPII